MSRFIKFVAAITVLLAGTSTSMAAYERRLYACEDGAQTSNPKLCADHGGLLGAKKAAKPIDTTQALTPNKSATSKTANTTTKTKSKTSTASTSKTQKKPVTYASSSPTAKCNDGAMYYSRERRGACASHGGVDKWIGF